MKYKFFTRFFISLLLFIVATVFVTNYVVDPYGKNNRFEQSFNRVKAVDDQRLDKYRLLEKFPDASSFIFGSSKAMALDPVLLGEITDTSALNMAFSSASADEYYLYIKYLTDKRKVKNIVIGIDLFAYTKHFSSNGTLPDELMDYFSMQSDYSLWNYISFKIFKSSIKTIRFNLVAANTNPLSDIVTERGRKLSAKYLEAKKNGHEFEKFISNNVINKPPRWGSRFAEISSTQLNYLKKIRQICDEKNINLYLFMTPLYIKQITMKKNRYDRQLALLEYLVSNIGPVLDFNNLSEINTDPYAYIDEFHYAYDVADVILRQLIQKRPAHKFYRGELISRKNLDDYLQRLRSEHAALVSGMQ